MTRKLVFCAVVASISAFGENWTGFLVDADCYRIDQENTKPGNRRVDQDRDFEVKQCAPAEKTKSFMFVDTDGQSFRLDAGGNAKAAAALRNAAREKPQRASITGTRQGNTLKVDSINIAK